MRSSSRRNRAPHRATVVVCAWATVGVGVGLSTNAGATDLGDARLDVARSESAMSCPDADHLAASIERIGQRQVSGPTLGELVLEVRIDRDDSGYSAEIRAFGRKSGVRRLAAPGPRCDGLASAVAVTLALLMDRQLLEESSLPPAAEPRPSPPVGMTRQRAPRPSQAPSWSFGLALEESLIKGMPQGWSAMAGLDMMAWRQAWLVSLGGFWTPTKSTSYDQGWIDVQLLGGRARGCHSIAGRWDQLHVGGCLEVAIARLHGEGHGYPLTRTRNRPWYAPGAGVRAGGPVAGPFFWNVEGAMLVPVYQETFSVDKVGTGFVADRVSWVVGAQAGARLF